MQYDWGSIENEDDPERKLMEFLVYHLGLFARKEGEYIYDRFIFITASDKSLQAKWIADLNRLGDSSFPIHRNEGVFGNECFKSTVQLLIDVVFPRCLRATVRNNKSIVLRMDRTSLRDHPLHLTEFSELIKTRVQEIELKKQTKADRYRILGATITTNISSSVSESADDTQDSEGEVSLDEEVVDQYGQEVEAGLAPSVGSKRSLEPLEDHDEK